jgi:hypothetical protein
MSAWNRSVAAIIVTLGFTLSALSQAAADQPHHRYKHYQSFAAQRPAGCSMRQNRIVEERDLIKKPEAPLNEFSWIGSFPLTAQQ